tara:strand:- start:3 stop:1868 length:1866 start_codon:yes stop_codon:yes gene_type:complete
VGKLKCIQGISTNSGVTGADPAGFYVDSEGTPQVCAAGTDTTRGRTNAGCNPILCIANQRVQNHQCVDCPPGKESLADHDASGNNTECDPTICPANYHVSSNVCTACPAGTTNASGDDASGSDTTCSATLCAADQHVVSNVCTACPAGTTNAAGDDASGSDTTCDVTLCAADQHVVNNICTACPAGTTNTSGDDASGSNTTCTETRCAMDEYVLSNVCTACPAGTTNDAGDDASGANTECNEPCSSSFICEDTTRGIDTSQLCNGICSYDDQGTCCSLIKESCSSYNTSFGCPSGLIINLNSFCETEQCNTGDYLNCCNIDYSNLQDQTFGATIESLNLYIISRVIYEGYDISSIPEGSAERAQFEEEFITALRTALGDDTIVIDINSIIGGSIIIDFTINTDETNLEDTRRNMDTVISNMDMLSVNLNGEQATPTIISEPRVVTIEDLRTETETPTTSCSEQTYCNVSDTICSTTLEGKLNCLETNTDGWKIDEGVVVECSEGEECIYSNQDCIGHWSPCTGACEKGEDRKYIVDIPKRGTGLECSRGAAEDCNEDDGLCKVSDDGNLIAYVIIGIFGFIFILGIVLFLSRKKPMHKSFTPPPIMGPLPPRITSPVSKSF